MRMMRLNRQATASMLVIYADASVPKKTEPNSCIAPVALVPEVNLKTPLQITLVFKRPLVMLAWNRDGLAVRENPHF